MRFFVLLKPSDYIVFRHSSKKEKEMKKSLAQYNFFMGENELKLELEDLQKKKREYDDSYYRNHVSPVSDREYDEMVARLREIEEELEIGEQESQRVGSDLSDDFPTVRHRQTMLSIDNSYNENDLNRFADSIVKLLGREADMVAEPKIDGLSMALWYEKGRLVRAVTRGNGKEGDDVTRNAMTLKEIPQKINDTNLPDNWEVRGEVYLARSRFHEINRQRQQEGKAVFANPRNAASGTLKTKDPEEVRKRQLSFFAYQLIEYDDADSIPSTHFERLRYLESLGFPVNPHFKLCKNREELFGHVHAFGELRQELDYETDGMVIKVNDCDQWEKLGSTAKSPRWVMAFKYPSEQASTLLKDVSLQVGRTGVITPVAELEPVSLAGTTVRRASLHNFQLIRERELRIGAKVIVEKAGEIIPQVLRVDGEVDFDNTREIEEPTSCPACGCGLKRLAEDAPQLLCPSDDCPERNRHQIRYFCSDSGMDIQGLGVKIIDLMLEKGKIRKLTDLYRLKYEDLEGMEGFAEKRIQNLLDAVEDSKNRDFETVLTSLGIPGLGRQNVRLLLEKFPSMEAIESAPVEEIKDIKGFGDVLAQNLKSWLDEPALKKQREELRELGLQFEARKQVQGNRELNGLSFVVTGTLPNMSRKEIEKHIEERGGQAKSSVSKKTDYVICGEEAGSKRDKAEKLGVPILSEEEYLKLCEEMKSK